MDYVKTYKIKKGDTLSEIAARYGTTVKKLASMNSIENPDKIYAGDELNVPDLTRNEVVKTMKSIMPDIPVDMAPPPMPNQMPPNMVPSLQEQALQPSMPESLLMGMPGMGKAAMGGLAGLSKMMPPMAKAGRVASTGTANVMPMGSNAGMNAGITQNILNNGPSPLTAMQQFRGIPRWLQDPRTANMMKQNPQRMQAELGRAALAEEKFKF